jgi:hypothetical protein
LIGGATELHLAYSVATLHVCHVRLIPGMRTKTDMRCSAGEAFLGRMKSRRSLAPGRRSKRCPTNCVTARAALEGSGTHWCTPKRTQESMLVEW